MSSRLRQSPSYLLCLAPPADASHRGSHSRSVERKHPFPYRRRSQISRSPEPSGLSQHLAQPSHYRLVDRKRSFPYRWTSRIAPPCRSSAPSQAARSSRRAVSGPWPPGSPTARRTLFRPRAFLAWPQASPRSRPAFSVFLVLPAAFFQRPASRALVSTVRLAAAQKQLQPAPATNLLVNW